MEISECPQCGAATKPSDRKCSYCKAEFFVTSLAYLGGFDKSGVKKYLKHYKSLIDGDENNVEGLLGLGLCYLSTGTFSLAERCFKKIIDQSPDVSHSYYYYSLAAIKGRRIMTMSLSDIRSIESYLSIAIQLDDEIPQYKLLLAMIRKDYYLSNGMKVPPPSSSSLLEDIREFPIDSTELEHIKNAAKVANLESYFSCLKIAGE